MADKKPAKKKTYKLYKLFESKGGLTKKAKSCPKCGTGYLLAQHKDRIMCGKCHYTEFTGKK